MTVRLQSTFFVLLTIFIFSFLLLPDDAHAQQPATTHTVQAGETLFSVARQYDLAVGDLRRWNDLDSDNLSIGQVLRIAPPKAENQITHTVKAEETLFSISRQYDVTIAEIQQWNDLQTTNLTLGRELTIYLPDDDQTVEPEEITESESLDEEREC